MSTTTPTTATRSLVIEGDIGVVTVAYPPVNALSRSMREAIIDGSDDLVVMVIASNDCSSDLTSAVKDVLGK